MTLFLTDNGPDGMDDTVAIVGWAQGVTPDCGATSPTQQTLSRGQISILHGESESGSVSGEGTSPYSTSSIRTFSFDADRDLSGNVTGSFSISESSLGGGGGARLQPVRDDRLPRHPRRPRDAHRPRIDARRRRSGGPGGGSTYYATVLVDDVARYGSGDRIQVNTYRQSWSGVCGAAPEDEGEPLITGDIDVNGVGGGPGHRPAAAIVASGSAPGQFGGPSTSFEVTAVADGAGGLSRLGAHQRRDASPRAPSPAFRVEGNQIVVGAQSINPGSGGGGGGGPTVLWFTLYLTDNGPIGTSDTAAFDGPGNMAPPDCARDRSVPELPLVTVRSAIVDGESEPGIVSGDGSIDIGFGNTRIFSFDAARDDEWNRDRDLLDRRIPGVQPGGHDRLPRHPG